VFFGSFAARLQGENKTKRKDEEKHEEDEEIFNGLVGEFGDFIWF
jgi:hypothetical protein